MSQEELVNLRRLEDDPAPAEAVQRAFPDSGLKTEVRVAKPLREAWDD